MKLETTRNNQDGTIPTPHRHDRGHRESAARGNKRFLGENMSEKKNVERNDEFTVTQPAGQVVNAAGIVVTMNPVGQQRKWVKLWISPWLTGTTRYVNTDAECAFWVDLIAEAGQSRFAGYICPGQENGELIGYPLAWYQRLRPSLDVMATLQKFATQDKIAYNITCENPVSIVVQILNWDKYQAPIDGATRAKDYRKRKKKQ